MVVVSDSGRTVVDFANVSLGEWTGTPAIFSFPAMVMRFFLNGRAASVRCWLQTPVTKFVMLLRKVQLIQFLAIFSAVASPGMGGYTADFSHAPAT